MLRTLLTRPAWWALTALLLVVVAVFGRLGLWQLHVAERDGQARSRAEQAALASEVDLVDYVRPHETMPDDGLGRIVRATGHYDGSRQFTVPDRRLDGAAGSWVVIPFVVEGVDGGSLGGAREAVLVAVRGFTTAPESVAAPADERLTLRGSLAPGESPAPDTHPAGVRGSVDLAELVNDWPASALYNAFVFVQSEEPAVATEGLTRIPPPVFGETGLDWRNLGYALQWWVFAAFAVYMWWRMLRDAADDRRAAAIHPTRPDENPGEQL